MVAGERILKELNMKNRYDELKCPKCSQIIKPAGIPLKSYHLAIYSRHVGSIKCLMKERHGDLPKWKLYSIYRTLGEDPPSCLCGCGFPVKARFDGSWRKYATRECYYKSISKGFQSRVKNILAKMVDGESLESAERRLNIPKNILYKILKEAQKSGCATLEGRGRKAIIHLKVGE
jgi:hypothetical protein